MVPTRLRLKNFMCYRGSDNEIDFSGIHLACLVGDNGQGKSALLDAITWALWGKARSNSADDLITYGETDMEVQLEFDLSGARYRVIRHRSSAGRGSSGLELQGRTESGFFASLSESTIRDSQKRITDLLKLDYETFVNSAFLLQGRADEFTTKRPNERKQILSDILGLAQYDEYAARAKEKARAAEARRVQLDQELESIRETVAGIPRSEEELLTAEGESARLSEQLRTANELLQVLLDQQREYRAKQDALTQAQRRIQDTREEIALVSARLEEQRERLARFDRLLERAEELEEAMGRLRAAREENERLNELLLQSMSLRNEAGEIKRTIDLARAALEGELNTVLNAIKMHDKNIERHRGQERELAEAQRQVEHLEKVQQEREEYQRMLIQWQEANGKLSAQNQQLKDAMTSLRERMDLLESTADATCPVCRQALSPEGRARALEEAQREGKSMGDRYRENQSEMQTTRREIRNLEEKCREAERQLKEFGRWQTLRAEATQAASEAQREREARQLAEQKAIELRARLDANDYATDEQARLAALASENASLGYDAAQHERAKKTIQELSQREQAYNELQAARQQRPGTVELVTTLEQQVARAEERIRREQQEIDRLSEELARGKEIERRTQEQKHIVQGIQTELVVAERNLGAARQKLEYAEQLAARQPGVEQALHDAIEERTVYEQLANAFGKRGVQAMIIESALPEIEAEANALLARMTDGRMGVALETQREARSGNSTIETLDILISDEHGQRPYETFSGGEAFRVNFALRIALSKLLAHRAGTSLRTLVMDEGFGSQDAQGRDRLVEAITSVQDDFERIIVITHIEELKDAFPVRIDVVKDSGGSRVIVN